MNFLQEIHSYNNQKTYLWLMLHFHKQLTSLNYLHHTHEQDQQRQHHQVFLYYQDPAVWKTTHPRVLDRWVPLLSVDLWLQQLTGLWLLRVNLALEETASGERGKGAVGCGYFGCEPFADSLEPKPARVKAVRHCSISQAIKIKWSKRRQDGSAGRAL